VVDDAVGGGGDVSGFVESRVSWSCATQPFVKPLLKYFFPVVIRGCAVELVVQEDTTARLLKPVISSRSAQLETIQALVCSGAGISLIPEMAARTERKDKPEYRSVSAPKPERKIVALWPRQRQPGRAAAEFLKLIVDQSRKKWGEPS
jgi:DNA-binding transcriptional LysR family regulator